MDLLIASVTAILGRYIIDKGAGLIGGVGGDAIEVAKQIWTTVIDSLKTTPTGSVVISEYEKNPDTYEKPLQSLLSQITQQNEVLHSHIVALVTRYHELAQSYSGPVNSKANETQGGSVAQGQGTKAQTATGKSIMVTDVNGNVMISGDKNVSAHTYIEGADPKHIARIRYEQELEKIDRNWLEERKSYIISIDNKDRIPSRSLALQIVAASGLGALIFSLMVLFISSGNPNFAAPEIICGIFFLFGIVGLLWAGEIMRKWHKYRDAEQRYQHCRNSIKPEDFV